MTRVVVVGSANLDLVVTVDHHPVVGETVLGGDLARFAGGKGANQAVAAARLDADTTFIGAVGSDDAGAFLVEGLSVEGIDTSGVEVVEERPTGHALIAVGADGDNTIIVSPGANAEVDVAANPHRLEAIGAADAVLCQLEIPIKAVTAVAAHSRGLFVLDPAPAPSGPLPSELLAATDVLVPNETELGILADVTITDSSSIDEITRAARSLDVETVVVTLGARGALIVGSETSFLIEAPTITPIDTTGAGDAFRACLAVELAKGSDPISATTLAVRVGAAATLRAGAQPSMPTLADVDELLGELS